MISHRDFQNRLMGTGEPHSTELILHLFKSIPIECMCLICVHTQWMIFSIHLTIECPMNKQPFSMPNLFPIRFYSPSIQLQIVVLSDVILGYIKTDTFHFSWRLALFAYC
eukprot:45510_1